MMSSEEESPKHKKLDNQPEEKANDDKVDVETLATDKDDNNVDAWMSWGQSLLQSAKEKTLTTYDMVKKDLAEFSEVVESETKTLVTSTSSAISEKASNIGQYVAPPDKNKGGVAKSDTTPGSGSGTPLSSVQLTESDASVAQEVSGADSVLASLEGVGSTMTEVGSGLMRGLISQVNKALYVRDTTGGEDDLEVPITVGGFPPQARQARLYAIQTDPGTYLNEPEGSTELYDDWIDNSFCMEDKKKEISELLATNPEVRRIYSQLVPSQTNNQEFWCKYFYKLHQFQLDGARRQAMMKLATQINNQPDEERGWGDESDKEDDEEPQPMLGVDAIVISQPEHIPEDIPSSPEVIPAPNEVISTSDEVSSPIEVIGEVVKSVKSDSAGSSRHEDEWSVVPSNTNSDDASNEDIKEEKKDIPKADGKRGETKKRVNSKEGDDDWIDWDNE